MIHNVSSTNRKKFHSANYAVQEVGIRGNCNSTDLLRKNTSTYISKDNPSHRQT